MRSLRRTALVLALLIMLSSTVFAADSISAGNKSLTGRHFLVLGDSITAGYGLSSVYQGWTWLMTEDYQMSQLNFSISGSTFASGTNGYRPMVQRCLDLPEEKNLDFVMLQGGCNDWSHSIPLGSDEDQNPATFCGALNMILDTLQQKYPDSVIIGFGPWISNEARNDAGHTQQDYTFAMLRIFARRGLNCYDASDVSENGMHLDQKGFRETYCLNGGDWYHLSPSGHAKFAPIFARWLESTLYPCSTFYDLALVSSKERSAILTMVDKGLLDGTTARLFSPTRAATRADLAQALYRWEGSPWASEWELSDMAYDDPAYSAVCWCLDAGLFTATDQFDPDGTLTREMMVTVLYRYYTEYYDKFVSNTVGLGTYPDGRDVESFARIPMGWALFTGVITELDGMLRPKGAVSRGQLALALKNINALPW